MDQPQPLRSEFEQAADAVTKLANQHQQTGVLNRLSELREDCASDLYTIVFLGEFNRGKSSLINALLRTDVLPMDVTPTTAAINVVRFNDTPLVRMQYEDHHTEDMAFSSETLRRFTGDATTAHIRYIEIGMRSPLLRDGTVLVDTPGVDDLDEHRVEITHNFVPRADAVVFVLSALTALNRSELEFLQNAVLKSGIDRLIFAVNFMDAVDEQEQAALLQVLSTRIRSAIPSHTGLVYPVSARRALRSIQSDLGSGLEDIVALEAAIESLRETREQDKLARHKRRLASIIEALLEQLTTSLAVSQAADEELKIQLQTLEESLVANDKRAERLRSWLSERQREAELMIGKSCDTFEHGLQAELCDLIAGYAGQDFESFSTVQIPRLVKARLKEWAETHAAPLSLLLCRISDELAASLSRSFNATVAPIRRDSDWAGITHSSFSLPAIELPNAMYRAGLIGGAAAGLMLLMGASVVVPLIGMLAYPMLRDKLHKRNLIEARQVVGPIVRQAVRDSTGNLRQAVTSAFARELEAIGAAAEDKFKELMVGLQHEIESEIQGRTEQRTSTSSHHDALNNDVSQLRELHKQVVPFNPAVLCLPVSPELTAVSGE